MEDMAMRTLNLDPFWRTSVGFDRLFDLVDQSLRFEPEDNYPPFNITRTDENAYRVSLAVAGFKSDQISLTVDHDTLIVTGHMDNADAGGNFLHRGIAARPFERRFNLAEYVEVKGASLSDGLLQIELVREVPEAMKPRRIAIISGPAPQDNARTIEHQAA
jgi:molecular chaperone IbpA